MCIRDSFYTSMMSTIFSYASTTVLASTRLRTAGIQYTPDEHNGNIMSWLTSNTQEENGELPGD